jgi:hypothetical protein
MSFVNLLLNKNFIKNKKYIIIYDICIILQEKLSKCTACLVDCISPSLSTALHPYVYRYLSGHEPALGRHNAWPAL